MFGDTDFAAHYGEVGFGRIELTFRSNGHTVEIPLMYVGLDAQERSIFRGNNPEQTSDVAEVVAPRNVQVGTTIQASYNGNVFPGSCASNLPTQPPTGVTPPSQGTWQGNGTGSGAVFSLNQGVNATLNYNRDNFSASLSVPPGTGAQVMYQGTITDLTGTGSNPNSFQLEGRVEAFASSANNLRVDDAPGICQIEVFDARIVSMQCSTSLPNSSTIFRGRAQF
ncbi:MAG: hypothetical protein HC910_10915 [Spirulinaceae cyanobacterium SM2_1_0]|nr:hypothetical protein [Spirulinaceae cyanobacterium SM2_1_0]